MPRRLRASLVVVIALLASLGTCLAASAQAASIPFTDPAAAGGIGLCSSAGTEIYSGNIYTRPFAPIAVSTKAAPSQYASTGRKAVLYYFQPLKDVLAENWTGSALSADSSYSNASVPMVASTDIDVTLADVMAMYPPTLDGLIQLRLIFGHIGGAYDTDTYAATVIQVSGSTWKVLNPVTVNCAAGKAVSAESLLSPQVQASYAAQEKAQTYIDTVHGPVSVVPPSVAPTVVTETPTPSTSGSGAKSKTSGSSTSSGATAPITAAVVPVTDLYKTSAAGSSTAETIGIGIAGVLLIAAAGGGAYFVRRGRHT